MYRTRNQKQYSNLNARIENFLLLYSILMITAIGRRARVYPPVDEIVRRVKRCLGIGTSLRANQYDECWPARIGIAVAYPADASPPATAAGASCEACCCIATCTTLTGAMCTIGCI